MKTQEVDLEVIPEEQRSFIGAEIRNLGQEIGELKVTNRDTYEKCLNLGIANVNILKRLQDLRKAMTAPYEATIKTIKDRFKPIEDAFSENDERVRSLALGYQKKVNVSNIKTIHTDMGRATIQERKDFEILDEAAVPREFLKVDDTKIRKAVTAGLLKDEKWLEVKIKLSTAFKAE